MTKTKSPEKKIVGWGKLSPRKFHSIYGKGGNMVMPAYIRRKYTQEEFIKKAKTIHGDKYDYSMVEYTGMHDRVKIICPKHGVFEQLAMGHVGGNGCLKCSYSRALDTETFIERGKKVHGDKYDYSLVNYKNNRTKVKIICPEHGEWEQVPNSHLAGNGCAKCPRPRRNKK
jgi:hypothetical protein